VQIPNCLVANVAWIAKPDLRTAAK